MKLIRFTIRSLSPGMLQNPASPELLESLRTKTPLQIRRDWTLVDEASTKLYRSEDGHMGVPMQNIMSCLVIAGTFVKSGKKNLSTAKSTTIFSFLDFVDDFCKFVGCKPTGPDSKKFDVDWKPFPMKGNMDNKGSKTAVCINRPRIPHWELQFTVRFDDKATVDEKTLILLVETAGRKVGLGDFAPRTRGRFGRFTVAKVEILPIPSDEKPVEVVNYTEKDAPVDLAALVT